jgi:hypothetical protein
MSNELRRVVQEFHGAYKSRIKGPSVYPHDKEGETAISESMFEDGSRREVRNWTASFLRLPRLRLLVADVTGISAGADLAAVRVLSWIN